MNNALFKNRYYNDTDFKNCGFKNVGKNVKIHENVNIYGIKNIVIGDNVRIDPYVSIIASGSIIIGSYVHIGSYSLLIGAEGITLENFTGLSQGVKIYTRSDDYSGNYLTNPTVPKKYLGLKKGPVLLKKHVIVGANTVILPGVIIGEGSSVGALSLVTKSIPGWYICAGIPAKKIKTRSKKILKLEKELLKLNISE